MFYQFTQNNSGGGFDYDEKRGISHYVIVEASDPDEANARAEMVGLYFDGRGDCTCCGNRWSAIWGDDEGEPVPSHYQKPIDLESAMPNANSGLKWMDGYEGFVHFADGRIVGFWT